MTTPRWRKSGYSNHDGGECVEFAANVPGVVPVRDTKLGGAGPTLSFGAAAWGAFVADIAPRWRKSSYSNQDGGNCVEVADNVPGAVPVRDAKLRGAGPTLTFGPATWSAFVAEIAPCWRKSSRSNPDGGQCVEVADNVPGLVSVRDSKDAGGPTVMFGSAAWSAFLTDVAPRWRKSGRSNQDGGACVEVVANVPGVVPVRDSKNVTGPTLMFGVHAWAVFVSDVTGRAA